MQIGICTFMYLSDNWFNRTMQQSSQEGIHFLAKAFHTVFSKCIITAADKGKWRLLISSFSFWKNHYLCHSLLHHYSRHISALRFIWVIIICNQGSEILSYPFVVNNQLQVFHPFSIFVPVPYPVIMLKLFFTWYWISTISDSDCSCSYLEWQLSYLFGWTSCYRKSLHVATSSGFFF